MNLKSKEYSFLKPELLVYFLPKGLVGSNNFLGVVRSVKKKEIDLEISSFNLLDSKPLIDFFSVLENRYCLYDGIAFFANQELSLGFNSTDRILKTSIFSTKKKKVIHQKGLTPFFEERKLFIKKFEKRPLIKTRLLMITKGGYLSLFFGMPAYVLHSYGVSNQRSYKSWFAFSCNYYGFLSCFNLVSLTKTKKQLINRDKKKISFYHLVNDMFSYTVLLKKSNNIEKI